MPLRASEPLHCSVIVGGEVAGSVCMLELGSVRSTSTVPLTTTALWPFVSRRRKKTGRSRPSLSPDTLLLTVIPLVALIQGLQVTPSVLSAAAERAAPPVEP